MINIYTDGSCQPPRHPKLAHAGWGIAFSYKPEDCDQSGAVKGSVQTSYRGELRAIAQALAVVKCPVLICSDCKSIVDQLQRYLDNKRIPSRTAAPLLWKFIYQIIDLTPEGQVQICWIPRYLDSKDKAVKREKALSNGLVSVQDIGGNVRADTMAAQGARAHLSTRKSSLWSGTEPTFSLLFKASRCLLVVLDPAH